MQNTHHWGGQSASHRADSSCHGETVAGAGARLWGVVLHILILYDVPPVASPPAAEDGGGHQAVGTAGLSWELGHGGASELMSYGLMSVASSHASVSVWKMSEEICEFVSAAINKYHRWGT